MPRRAFARSKPASSRHRSANSNTRDIIRDREVAKLKYDDLNKKRSQSQIAEDLERRQQGETLEVLDPASLPQSPTQPKRPSDYRRGTGMGLVLGCSSPARARPKILR